MYRSRSRRPSGTADGAAPAGGMYFVGAVDMSEPRPGRGAKADDSRAGVTPPASGRSPVPDDDPLVITPVRGRIPRPFPIGESRVLSTEPREPGAVKRDSGVMNRDSYEADRAAQDDSRT